MYKIQIQIVEDALELSSHNVMNNKAILKRKYIFLSNKLLRIVKKHLELIEIETSL